MASWFSEGTVTVQNGSPTVTGVGTKFSNCRAGDMFVGPDQGIYQVINPASDTSLSISPAYRGAAVGGAGYGIVPVNGYPKALADAVNQMVQQWGATLAGLGPLASASVALIANGGTSSTTASGARVNLGLGTAATASLTSSDNDPTTGRVLKVGDFGLGASLGGPVRGPNLAYNPGFFRFNGEEAGVPVAGTGGSLIINTVGGSYIQQIAQTPGGGINNPYVAVRHFSSTGSPGPWCLFYHTGNTTKAADGTLKAI